MEQEDIERWKQKIQRFFYACFEQDRATKLKHRQCACKRLRTLSPASVRCRGAVVQNSSARVQASSSTSHHEEAVCAGASWLFASDVVRV